MTNNPKPTMTAEEIVDAVERYYSLDILRGYSLSNEEALAELKRTVEGIIGERISIQGDGSVWDQAYFSGVRNTQDLQYQSLAQWLGETEEDGK